MDAAPLPSFVQTLIFLGPSPSLQVQHVSPRWLLRGPSMELSCGLQCYRSRLGLVGPVGGYANSKSKTALSLSLVCVCSNLPSSIPLSSGVPTTTPDPLFWPQWPLIHVSERPNEGLKGRGLVSWGGRLLGRRNCVPWFCPSDRDGL